MKRKFESLTRRLDAGHLKDVEAAATHRMANIVVQDVFTHGAYARYQPLRHLIVAYSGIATPPSKGGGAAWGQTYALVHAQGDCTR
jgi:hypothetical protein